MAFWDRTDARVPEKLRELTPEQMEKALDFYNANKDKVGALETELTTSKQTLADVETQFTETKNRLAQLEASVATQPPVQPQPAAQAGTSAPTDWFENPDRAFIEKMKPVADYALGQGAVNARRDLEDYLRENPGKLGDNFKLYRKYQREIWDLMSREALANQANSQAWMNAFLMVKGIHDDEITAARGAGDGAFFGEQAKSSPSPAATAAEDNITDRDKEQAKKFDVTPEQVRTSRKSLTYGDTPAKGF
jgi:hypothetical protein